MWVSGSVRASAWAVLCVAMLWSGVAAAQSDVESVEGHVLEIDEAALIVDLAGARGASDGDVLELWRPLRLRHPVTGKPVVDRFLIGRLKLTQVRDRLALAKIEGKVLRPAAVGDVVILRREPKETEAPKQAPTSGVPAPAAPSSAAPTDPEVRTVTELFESLRGAPVRARVVAYEKYVRAHPNGRFAVVLYEEAVELRRLVELEMRSGRAAPPSLSRYTKPEYALAGQPLTIGIELEGAASGAVLHSRREGEVAYVSTPMQPAGPGYYTLSLPGARLQAPRFYYFIEATTEAGNAVPVVGSGEQPELLKVHEVPKPTPPPHHESTLHVITDYADWNELKGNDVVWQTEGYFGMRFRDVGLRAARTGFGVYRGIGGSLEELDELGLSGRKVGLTYGYLEGEFGISEQFSLLGRAVAGLRDDGLGAGAQALVRIGNDKRTNLELGGEAIGGIGLRSITQLELRAVPRVPILLRTEVTNQPAGASADEDARPADPALARRTGIAVEKGELGARAIVQVGYQFFPELMLAVRGSYQGRTINHAGPGVGGAVTYTW